MKTATWLLVPTKLKFHTNPAIISNIPL